MPDQTIKQEVLDQTKKSVDRQTACRCHRNICGMRHRYAQSEATLAIKSEYNKDSTWRGAIENLKNLWSIPSCWNHTAYPENKALIERNAIPVGEE